MAWVAVDRDGTENIFPNKPSRAAFRTTYHTLYNPEYWSYEVCEDRVNFEVGIELPKGSIRKLIGRDLSWKDEPVELKEE